MTNDIRELILEDGSSPCADWFNKLPADAAAKVAVALVRMRQGNLSKVEWFRGIGEYKIDFGPGRSDDAMALTRNFKATIVARVSNDPQFARAMLDEAATLFLNGEPDTAKFILRNLVNATIGFEQLAQSVDKPIKSVHRMLSATGNPTMSNLAAIFASLKNAMKVDIQARAVPIAG